MSSTDQSAPPVLELTAFVERVHQRLDAHVDAPLWSAPAEELTGLTVALERLEARFAAAKLAVIREVDRRQAARELGAPATSSWLRNGPARMTPREATKTVHLGKDLEQTLHATRRALSAGQLSLDHAQVIAGVIKKLPPEVDTATKVKAEEELVARARDFNPHSLAILGKTVLDVVAPDLADELLAKQLAEEERKANRVRELTLTPDRNAPGSYYLRGKVDPETAEMLRTCLDPFAKPRPKDATGEGDARSYPERMGDALNEFLWQSLDRGDVVPTHGGNKPHIVITVKGEHWMTGMGYGRFMMSQQPVSMQTLYRIANDAIISTIERGVDPDDPNDVRRVRKVTGWLRLQLQIRDGGCAFPGCDRPPSDCEAHHILAWHRGGPTVLKNLVLLCRHHHKLMDHPDWIARINPEDHLPEFVPPSWVDPNQKPLRNSRLQI